jgi:ABC-type amino acid transport substrate-binding protein/nitrogen-specific signal transduction histidine kinase
VLYKYLIILSIFFVSLFATNISKVQQQDINLALSWKHQFQFAGYYMAKHKGFYDDVDLNVNIAEFEFGMNVTDEVMSGKYHFGVGRSSLLIDKIANNKDILLLSAIFQHSPLVLHAKKRPDIKTIQDIKNKKVMVTNDKAIMAAIEAMLVANGLKQSDYEPIKHSFNPNDLINGKTDLMASYISNEPFRLKEKGVESIIFNPKDYGFNFYGDILFTSKAFQNKNQKLVDDFYKASIKGWIYAFDNIEETVDVILKHYNKTLKKTKEALLYEGMELKKLAYVDDIALGTINKYKLENIANTYYLLNILHNKIIDFEDIIYKPINKDQILLTPEEQKFLNNNKVLKVHNEMDWIPYNYNDKGVAKGYSIDYMNLVAAKLGVSVEYVSGPTWSEFLTQMKDGSLDVMLNIRKTAAREQYLSFTSHYAQSFKGIFTNQKDLKSLNDLKGKRIAVIKDFFIHDFIKEHYPQIIPVPHDSVLDSLISLTNGNVDAAVNDISVMKFVSKQNFLPVDYMYVLNDDGLNSKMSIATAKNNEILKKILQKAMDSITDLQLNILKTKWLGKSDKKSNVSLTKLEKKWISENIVTVGIEEWKPLVYFDSESQVAKGIVGDILKLAIDNLGLKVKYTNNKWDYLLQNFKEKKIDLLPATYFTDERATYGTYTDSYLDIKESIFVKKSNSDIKKFEDLKNKKIAIIKDYGTIPKIKEAFPSIEIVETKDLQESVDFVLNGKVDALVDTQISVATYLNENLILGLKSISQNYFSPAPLHFFTNQDKPMLAQILNKSLAAIDETTINKIVAKWINSETQINSFLSNLTKLEKDRLKKKKVIKMCNNPKWEPIEFAQDNNMEDMKGIVLDTLALLEKKLDVKFENVPTTSWSESQQFLKEKKCDILPAAIKTSSREQYANFTKPYLDYKLAIITKTNIPHVDSLNDIIDSSMSRNKGSGLISKLKKQYPNIKIKETEGYLDSLREVSQGNVKFTIATLPVATYFITKYAMYDLHIAGYTNMRYKLSMAVRDDDTLLLSILDKGLENISQQEMKDIHNKWTNVKLENNQIDQRIIIGVVILLVVVILLALFLTYRQYMLKKINSALENTVEDKSIELEKVNKELLKYSKELQELNENLEQRIVFEVDKSKKMEHKLFESEKMAAMGEMIGNIAHQWRQPLSVISTSATGVVMQKEYGILTDEQLIHFMDEINNSAQFLSQTIDDFRDLVKGDSLPESFNLTENLNRCLAIETPILKNNDIELIKHFDDSLELVSLPNALVQSMINIVNNAKDVLLEKVKDDRYIFISTYKANAHVVIEVKDNGGGIPENVIEHIFEPYFTTKHKEQGTGLGLNMTYTMITKDMKGKIEAMNQTYDYNDKVYTGAVFKITIPLG